MMLADGEPVPDDRMILRLPKPPLQFAPGNYVAAPTYVSPSTEDKDRIPVRISVWDAALTTLEQARGFRSEEPVLVLEAQVAGVLQAGARAVVYEPLTGAAASQPGAPGHAGIEGLERAPGEQKIAYKHRLSRVAMCFRLIGW